MAVSYAAENRATIKLGIGDFIYKIVKPQILAMLKSVATRMVAIIDGDFAMPDGTTKFPVSTANLHDATGVGVYDDGKLSAYVPSKRATKKQRTGLGSPRSGIDGNALLQTALADGAGAFSKGMWIVLFSTVPYAYHINTAGSKIGRGVGYFKELEDVLTSEILAGLKPIAPVV